MPSKNTSPVGIRLHPEEKLEWEQWRSYAEQEGIEFRTWLFTRIRQSLAPKPVKAVTTTGAAQKRGYRLGMMVGRLDAVFIAGTEDDIDLGWVMQWIRRYPELVPEVSAILTGESYGLRFYPWWQARISRAQEHHPDASVHNHVESR